MSPPQGGVARLGGASSLRGAGLCAALFVLLSLPPGLARAEQIPRSWLEWQTDKLLDSATLSALRGDLAAALRATERATALSPEHAEAWATRAQLLASLLPPGGGAEHEETDAAGRAAETAWTRWSTLAPSSAAAQLLGFQIALDTGRLDVASERLEVFLERPSKPNEQQPQQERGPLDRHLARAELAAQRGEWDLLAVELHEVRGDEERIDLSPLPLQPRWRRFAATPQFIQVLNSVLGEP